MDDNTAFLIQKFEKYVHKHFNFLEKSGFKKKELQKLDFEYPQDKHVEIEYYSDVVFVTISWYLIESNIGVGISEFYNGKKHEKYSAYGDEGFGRGIILYDLVEYITNKKVKRPLPEILYKDSTRTIMKKVQESANLINDNFENVIEDFANLLKDYAMDILNGDLSVFPKVQEYSKIKNDGYI